MKKLFLLAFIAIAFTASAQVLYKIEGNGLASPSYIFGTHHLAPLSVIDKFGAKEPFESCSQVVGEIDMTQNPMNIAAAMQPHMMAPADSTLSKVISPLVYDKVNEEFKKLAPMQGMDLSMLEQLKPIAVNTTIAVGLAKQAMPDYNPAEQLDTWFQTTGKKENKKIVPLETVEQQAAILFDSMPIAYQAEDLVDLLLDSDKAVRKTKELCDAYMAQDLDKLLSMSESEDSRPEFMQALLDKRNTDWLSRLPEILKNGSSFIAVGALHLAGEKGIVKGLRNLGYTVTPINATINK